MLVNLALWFRAAAGNETLYKKTQYLARCFLCGRQDRVLLVSPYIRSVTAMAPLFWQQHQLLADFLPTNRLISVLSALVVGVIRVEFV